MALYRFTWPQTYLDLGVRCIWASQVSVVEEQPAADEVVAPTQRRARCARRTPTEAIYEIDRLDGEPPETFAQWRRVDDRLFTLVAISFSDTAGIPMMDWTPTGERIA